MKAIGGYFELEFSQNGEYHDNAINLNSGRNAFEYLLLANNYKKVYLPYFTCDALLEPLKKNGVRYEFYVLDESLEPQFKVDGLKDDEAFLYINYFGLKDHYVGKIAPVIKNLIVDNSQSFFSKPVNATDTFYSARKFFGVPDGAYLFTKNVLENSFMRAKSYERCAHLLLRLDLGPESGYDEFLVNEERLKDRNIELMSNLTSRLLLSIDYRNAAKRRQLNFKYLQKSLGAQNRLKFENPGPKAPMTYPYWSDIPDLRERLLEEKIFTPTYWPEVLKRCQQGDLEYDLVREVVHLPVDQRYSEIDLNKVLKMISNV